MKQLFILLGLILAPASVFALPEAVVGAVGTSDAVYLSSFTTGSPSQFTVRESTGSPGVKVGWIHITSAASAGSHFLIYEGTSTSFDANDPTMIRVGGPYSTDRQDQLHTIMRHFDGFWVRIFGAFPAGMNILYFGN